MPEQLDGPEGQRSGEEPDEQYTGIGRPGKVRVPGGDLDGAGTVDRHHRLSRERFQRFFAEQERMEVLMEACGTAHHWGRELEALGHQVRLLPPSDVARYRDGNKTDRADAIAILEASRNERIDAVPVKTIEQQALTSLHRLRSAYVADRTARINTVRGILREFGHAIPQGARTFVERARLALDDDQIPHDLRVELSRALDEIAAFRETITEITNRIEGVGAGMPDVEFLRSVPGIGVLTATALVAFVGDVDRFRSALDTSPPTSGSPRGSTRPGYGVGSGASPSGATRYLRMLLIHGARSALLAAPPGRTARHLQTWALGIELRTGTTSPPSRSPTNSPASYGESGETSAPFERR